MTGSSNTHSSTGSKGIFNGSFYAVDYAENILRRYDDALMSILQEKAQDRQREIRETARTSDTGWAAIADSIEVNYDHESRNFTYTISGDEAVHEKAMNLEYGNGHLAPTPLLRGTVLQQQDKDTRDIDNALRNLLSQGI